MSVSVSASFLKPLSSLLPDERAVMAVRVQPTMAVAAARRKFHLAVSADTSGSMAAEGRLDAVKMTLTLLLPSLEDGDILTIITYNSTATLLAEAVVISAETRTALAAQIATLQANGGTNAESIVPHLRAVKDAHPPIDKLFFLTDGEIVEGLQTASGLYRVFQAALPAGTPVDTLGFGTDCNARLLRRLADLHRGFYTFADAAEMLPRIIANISTGLATEVGRNGVLAIPAGWKSLELSAKDAATSSAEDSDPSPAAPSEQPVGLLIADKDSWVVLQATGPVSAPPSLVFTSSLGAVPCDIREDIPALAIAEQLARVDMANAFNIVTEQLESGHIAEARATLTALNGRLGTSLAKDSATVIGYMAQVDENLELLRDAPEMDHGGAAGAGGAGGGGRAGSLAHPPPPGGLRRQNAMWGAPSPPLLAPVLSRMHSNTSALSQQQGVFSSVSSVGHDRSATGHINVQFTSRQQTSAMRSASQTYYDHTPTAVARDLSNSFAATLPPPPFATTATDPSPLTDPATLLTESADLAVAVTGISE